MRDKERANVVMFTNVDGAGSMMQTGGERTREREKKGRLQQCEELTLPGKNHPGTRFRSKGSRAHIRYNETTHHHPVLGFVAHQLLVKFKAFPPSRKNILLFTITHLLAMDCLPTFSLRLYHLAITIYLLTFR